MSLRFGEGTTRGDTIDFSSIGGPPYDGEQLQTFSSDASGNPWGSGLALVWNGMADGGSIYINLPLGIDANNAGFDDFFEVLQGGD